MWWIHTHAHRRRSAKKGRIRRNQILSWLTSTSVKRKWLSRLLLNVSYYVIRTAERWSRMWGPGGNKIRLSLTKKRYQPSERALYLKQWLQDNVECDPAGKNKLRRLRFLRRHSGHKIYCIDCKRQKPHLEPYGRTQFYRHPLQDGISDTKVHAGLCSICTRWGEMCFVSLEQHAIELHMILKRLLSFDIDTWKKKFKEVRTHFVRGGMFQRSLQKSCNNQHLCMTFALSHPNIKAFQGECDHDHDLSDPKCVLRDELWEDLYDYIADAVDSGNADVIAFLASAEIVGEAISTTVKTKLINIRKHLTWLRRGHDKFIGHLMLDTMQSLKRFEMREAVSQTHLLEHTDYMMKLRPLIKKETGSDFHMVMSKGDSVLVSGFSYIGTDADMKSVHAEDGDAMLHHVVTISGDTTQGLTNTHVTCLTHTRAHTHT